MTTTDHAPKSKRKRERACVCGAIFATPKLLRRHVRHETGEPLVLWADAIGVSKARREASR
jgi:hypothetical protein